MQCPLLEDLLKLLDETQSHRKEPHVISSNTVITSCEKGRKWFLSSVLWIDAKFVGVIEPLRVRLFTAVVHPLYCGILTEPTTESLEESYA